MEQLTLPLDELLAEDFERLFTEREDKRRKLAQHVDWLLAENTRREYSARLTACVQANLPWPPYVLFTSDGRPHVLEKVLFSPIDLLNLR